MNVPSKRLFRPKGSNLCQPGAPPQENDFEVQSPEAGGPNPGGGEPFRAARFGALLVETVTQGGASLALGLHRNGPLGLRRRPLNLTPMGETPARRLSERRLTTTAPHTDWIAARNEKRRKKDQLLFFLLSFLSAKLIVLHLPALRALRSEIDGADSDPYAPKHEQTPCSSPSLRRLA
jgi:hypothetical protein